MHCTRVGGLALNEIVWPSKWKGAFHWLVGFAIFGVALQPELRRYVDGKLVEHWGSAPTTAHYLLAAALLLIGSLALSLAALKIPRIRLVGLEAVPARIHRHYLAGPTGDLTYICGANGRPLTKESFGNDFADACRAAGIRKSAHGLRKLAAVIMAHDNASVSTLNAVSGWTGFKMALRYTQAAERARLALDAWRKRMNDSATSIPAPEVRCGS
jgi:hypothetical protein